MPITSAPPPARKTAPAAKAVAQTQTRDNARYEAINGLGQIAQAILVTTRQYADAGAVGMYFPAIASEVTKLASADERIARFVDPLLQAGPYAGLVAAVLPLAMQVAVNHGRAQAGVMGTVTPSFLEAKIKTGLAQAELQAKKELQTAEAELARLQNANGSS